MVWTYDRRGAWSGHTPGGGPGLSRQEGGLVWRARTHAIHTHHMQSTHARPPHAIHTHHTQYTRNSHTHARNPQPPRDTDPRRVSRETQKPKP